MGKSKVWTLAIAFLIICGILVGCRAEDVPETSQADAKKQENSPIKGEKEESNAETIPSAATTMEETVVQKPGRLVDEHMEPEIEAARTVDFTKYFRYYEDTFLDIVHKELPAYFQKNTTLSPEEVYDYLVYELGSGQYEPYYEKLVTYDHGYEMPELPQGEDEIELAKKEQTNLVILMDASGSMKATIADDTRMDLAKEAIEKFTKDIGKDVNVSLLAYGHKGTGDNADKKLSCSSIDTIYPLKEYNQTEFHQALNSFQASGWTPLAGAMEKANDLLAPYGEEGYRNIVYIVSDGVETCDGDPIAAAKKLNESNIEAKVNIIGFDVDNEGQTQLKQVAEAGGGQYATVRDPAEFDVVLKKKWQPSMMQVMSQQGVHLHELVDQLTELTSIYDPLSNLSAREAIRISDATRFLLKEEWIDQETADYIAERSKQMEELRKEHFQQLKEEKSTEAENARKEIDTEVEAWKEKWYKEIE
ncbi:hypothetical protein J2Z23_002761 [Lederbergia galactosidilyticus]|uniref:vWA domain-containing protein n=1 Tax=Lederbergia galactosidilytica TaxID=217031 RepID=UPI001AE4EEB5|nr:VWA domain-containing protein [Lederbergia galactosidilytica]MBP1915779.1 hypothetical protein [Lederbergia galactosidilytica]